MENKKKYQKIEKLSDEEQENLLKDMPRLSKFMVINETDLDYVTIGKTMEGFYKSLVIDDDVRKAIKNNEECYYDLTFRVGKESLVEYVISAGFNLKDTNIKNVFRIAKNRDLTKYEATRPVGTPDFVKKGFGEIR